MTNPFDGETKPAVKFEDLVGEDKRYKTNDDFANALVEKDLFIEQLKRENAEARDAAVKAANQEEFLKRLEEVTQRKSLDPKDPPTERKDEPTVTGVKIEDVEKMLEEREAKKAAEANLNSVVSKLQELFGDDWRSRVQSKAKELGVGTQFLTDIATKTPQAFYRLLGVDEAPTAPAADVFAPPRSNVNTSAPLPQGGKKDYQYFSRMRAEKGEAWYFSLPVQQEIWKAAKDAEKRGEQFLPTRN